MEYLHKNKIVHGDLNPRTILIDDFYQPKIIYSKIPKIIYETYKNFDENDDLSLNFIPENIFDSLYYDKANDVLSFASILYLILNGQEKPSKKVNKPFQFDDNVSEAFQRLYEKCCSEDPEKRLTFESITYSLKNDDEFISEKVDKEFYYAYIESIERASLIEISKIDDNDNEEDKNDSQNDDSDAVDDLMKNEKDDDSDVVNDFQKIKNESDDNDDQSDSQNDDSDAYNDFNKNENDIEDDDDSDIVNDFQNSTSYFECNECNCK